MNRSMNRGQRSRAGAGVPQLLNDAVQRCQSGHLREAEHLLRRVLALDPRHSVGLHLLGVVAAQTGRDKQAVELIGKAIAVNPRDATAHSSLGNVLQQQGRLDEAIASYRRAIAVQPAFPEALNNLGNALKAQKKLEEAIGCYRRALATAPDNADTHYNLAMALLAQGELLEGWKEHEWRWATRQFSGGRRRFAQPQWRGEAAEGRTLLVHAEQGFGDTLQFCRYVPLAAARRLRVVLQVPKPLVRSLRNLAGVDRLLTEGDALPPFDLHCPVLSLPLALRTTLGDIPCDVPYLHADPMLTAEWGVLLSAVPAPRIGVAWAGNPRAQLLDAAAIGRVRSIAPDRLAPVFELPDLHFVSLQKDGAPAPERFALVDRMADVQDFADTAAVIVNLDLVVSVDTSVAHLAAALGKPVWLLNCFDPCWRWLTGRRDSPWYPTMRLYQQPQPGDWDAVVAELARDLRDWGDRSRWA